MIDAVTLVRYCYADFGTFGKLSLPDGTSIYTVERAWLDNRVSVSCIPEGEYSCGPKPFFRGGYDAVEIIGVPGRTHILFHKANWPYQLEGCIAPNSRLGPGTFGCPLRGYASANAFRHLMDTVGREEFTLHITNNAPRGE